MKITAAITLFIFTASSVSVAGMPGPIVKTEVPPAVAIREPLVIPEALGTIQDQVISSDPNKPFVAFIQDAHAMVDAQDHIQQILQYLQDKYHVSLIALEGGIGQLDSTLFRAYPDPKQERKVMRSYLERGELSGPQMAAMFNTGRAEYIGIENWKLYEANYLAYIRARQSREAMEKNLDELTFSLDEKRKTVYSPELSDFHEHVEKFRGREGDLWGLLQYLNRKALSEEQKNKYPRVNNLLQSLNREKEVDTETLQAEIQQLAEQFRRDASAKMSKRRLMKLNAKIQAFSTGTLDPASFLNFLVHCLKKIWASGVTRVSSSLTKFRINVTKK